MKTGQIHFLTRDVRRDTLALGLLLPCCRLESDIKSVLIAMLPRIKRQPVLKKDKKRYGKFLLPYRERWPDEDSDNGSKITRGAITILPQYSHTDDPAERAEADPENLAGTLYHAKHVDYDVDLLIFAESGETRAQARKRFIRDRLRG